MFNDMVLSQMVCSKLCHDLISPAGSLRNGLEILTDYEWPSDVQPVMDIILQSSETLVRRLVFFRTVFGANSASQFKNYGDVIGFLDSYLQGTSLVLKVDKKTFQHHMQKLFKNQHEDWARLLGLIVAVFEDISVKETVVVFYPSQNGLEVSCEGTLVPLKKGIQDMFAFSKQKNAFDALMPQNISFFYIHLLMSKIDLEGRLQKFEEKKALTYVLEKKETRSSPSLFSFKS